LAKEKLGKAVALYPNQLEVRVLMAELKSAISAKPHLQKDIEAKAEFPGIEEARQILAAS